MPWKLTCTISFYISYTSSWALTWYLTWTPSMFPHWSTTWGLTWHISNGFNLNLKPSWTIVYNMIRNPISNSAWNPGCDIYPTWTVNISKSWNVSSLMGSDIESTSDSEPVLNLSDSEPEYDVD